MLIFLFGLVTLPAGECQPDKIVGGATAKTKHVAVKPIPKSVIASRDKAGCKFHRKRAMSRARDIFAQLLFVRREDADATPSA
ncbi:MAG TPA: hypothetical protein VMV89_08345 [Candidatus Paceibacterota bacterium]|nr:hypothetical protein [Candidatus Paceibacterota bacterium]